jgi:hypothetical protein
MDEAMGAEVVTAGKLSAMMRRRWRRAQGRIAAKSHQCAGGCGALEWRPRHPPQERCAMTTSYLVGVNHKAKTESVTVDAEDALIAALKVKHDYPQAKITYVRKSNARGDRRHPHHQLPESRARR